MKCFVCHKDMPLVCDEYRCGHTFYTRNQSGNFAGYTSYWGEYGICSNKQSQHTKVFLVYGNDDSQGDRTVIAKIEQFFEPQIINDEPRFDLLIQKLLALKAFS